MSSNILFELISSWQVVLVSFCLLIILPTIYYLASCNKKPVKIKRIPQTRKNGTPNGTPKDSPNGSPAGGMNEDATDKRNEDETDNNPGGA